MNVNVDFPRRLLAGRYKSSLRSMLTPKGISRRHPLAPHGFLGLALIAMAWPASWLQAGLLGEYAFFPLWLGYIFTVDALVLRSKGSSPLTRNPKAFGGLFLVSIPLWWTFEGINQFTQNWYYVSSEEYSTLRHALVASWHFSTVVPAVIETAELIGTLKFFDKFQSGPALQVSKPVLAASMILGLILLLGLMVWPTYFYPGTWMWMILLVEPINYLRGRQPSILVWLSKGDWRPLVALAFGALVCGWFWEMWNYWADPKWEYVIAFFDFAPIFEMPVLGYGGYLPFGLECYVAYVFLTDIFGGAPRDFIRIDRPKLQVPQTERTANLRTQVQ